VSAPDWRDLAARLGAMAAETGRFLETLPGGGGPLVPLRMRVESLDATLGRAQVKALRLAREAGDEAA
jgi:hypothetical protein